MVVSGRRGYFVSADHRLLPASVPDMQDDVAALLNCLASLPMSYDKHSVVLSGDSSGGLLALLAAWHFKMNGIPYRGLLAFAPLGGTSFVRLSREPRNASQACQQHPAELLSNPCPFFQCYNAEDAIRFAPTACNEVHSVFAPYINGYGGAQRTARTGLDPKTPNTARLPAGLHPSAFLMRYLQRQRGSGEHSSSKLLDVLVGTAVQVAVAPGEVDWHQVLTPERAAVFPMLAKDEEVAEWPRTLFVHVRPRPTPTLADLFPGHGRPHRPPQRLDRLARPPAQLQIPLRPPQNSRHQPFRLCPSAERGR
jgi:hypothetical protein